MKYLSICTVLLLTGCQATPTLCEIEPNAFLCDSSSYNVATVNALTTFESRAGRKAFALGKTYNGGEFYGFSEGYSSQSKANTRALDECKKRLAKYDTNAQCELIR
ncbi:hypothetical protein [Pseudoalteromonas sp. Z1A8]|uniref:hypothetical protein n=1 Tax=Pseudoalteromonas sp. Z1A8 TaxID=2686354 RepID=UPI001407EC13|nr:hypothetical protein [Pseudoalteromonas sp. Z1A8]